MLEMWQLMRGEKYYWFQTKDRATYNKMKKRKKFRLISRGMNCDWWIFEAEFTRPDIARNALKTLAGNPVKYDKKDDIFYAEINYSKSEKEAA